MSRPCLKRERGPYRFKALAEKSVLDGCNGSESLFVEDFLIFAPFFVSERTGLLASGLLAKSKEQKRKLL